MLVAKVPGIYRLYVPQNCLPAAYNLEQPIEITFKSMATEEVFTQTITPQFSTTTKYTIFPFQVSDDTTSAFYLPRGMYEIQLGDYRNILRFMATSADLDKINYE